MREFVCKDCDHIGEANGSSKRGSFWIETILWTAYMFPGLIYTIWRRLGKSHCKKCGSTNLAKLHSTYGQMIVERTLLENITKK